MAVVGMTEGEEEEMTVSSYSVVELWQRLPLHLVKDIFGYFSLQDVGQKPRVSRVWKLMLSKLAGFNHGILFLDNRDVRYAKWHLSLLTEGTIGHLVLHGATWYVQHLREQLIEYCTMTSLSKLTFYKAKLSAKEFLRAVGLPLLYPTDYEETLFSKTNIGRIDCVNCTFEVSFSHWVLVPPGDSSLWGSERRVKFLWNCSYSIERAFMTFSRETDAELQHEFERQTCRLHQDYFNPEDMAYTMRLDQVRQEVYVQGFLQWCFSSKDLARASLWPYPDATKQLQWLKTSLDELDAGTEKSINRAYLCYKDAWRKYIGCSPNRKKCQITKEEWQITKEEWQIMEDIYWEEWNEDTQKFDLHKLDLLDCAFFAAVLNITPGIPEAPYPIDSLLKIEQETVK